MWNPSLLVEQRRIGIENEGEYFSLSFSLCHSVLRVKVITPTARACCGMHCETGIRYSVFEWRTENVLGKG